MHSIHFLFNYIPYSDAIALIEEWIKQNRFDGKYKRFFFSLQ